MFNYMVFFGFCEKLHFLVLQKIEFSDFGGKLRFDFCRNCGFWFWREIVFFTVLAEKVFFRIFVEKFILRFGRKVNFYGSSEKICFYGFGGKTFFLRFPEKLNFSILTWKCIFWFDEFFFWWGLPLTYVLCENLHSFG